MKNSYLNTILSNFNQLLLVVILVFFGFTIKSQVDNGFNEFKYPSGKVASEGFIVNGKPEGYWKTYYENGNIKSEGNRLNHELDSVWKFYDEDGVLSVTIDYLNSEKNGWRTTFRKDYSLIKEELFKNDTIQLLKEYHTNGRLKLKIPFENGLKFGFAFQYDTSGLEKVFWKYSTEKIETFKINRLDAVSKKTGKWMIFQNEILVKETNYSRGLKNGIERIFDYKGNLKEVLKYSNGKLLKDVRELQKVNLEKELGANGLIAKSGGFNNEGKPHGVHREYDDKGEVKASKIYNNGVLSGVGIVQKNGNKNGDWILYYSDGSKQAEGKYKDGKKIGYWKHYYENGNIESEGGYSSSGKQDGLWKEYFESGILSEEINYYDGLYDGHFKAFNDSGEIIIQGKYKEDYEDSTWVYTSGDHYEFGAYNDGLKVGEWRAYYLKEASEKKQIIFRGSFENGLPTGEHLIWYPSGGLRYIGSYRAGRKTGKWTEYSKGGKIIMVTEYTDGLARKLNGYSIDPVHDQEDYIEYESTGYGK